MSDIVGEHARITGAYDQPTLTLLNQKHAPVIVAIFRTAFTRDTRTLPTARLHTQVETYLDELRLAGIDNVPTRSGRDLCMRAVKSEWLTRNPDETGDGERYALTSHAQDAIETVTRLERDRTTLSEHRIATFVNAARRFNTDINPDPARRIDNLNDEIAKLTAERDRLAAGGDLPDVTEDYFLEGSAELLDLVSDLPRDFARVEEALTGLRTEILASFRTADIAAGHVLDDYLARSDRLMGQTVAGRAFEGAVALLRDDAMLSRLRDDLRAIADHPQAADILTTTDRRELTTTANLLSEGIERVLARRNKVTATLRDYIVTHDVTSDREVDTTLRQLEAELTAWVARTGPATTLELDLLPPQRGEIATLSERFHNPADETPPPPLTTPDIHTEGPSLKELRAYGGPTFETFERLINGFFGGDLPEATIAEMFANLEPSLRRPVELLGLLSLAEAAGAHIDTETTDAYKTVRPDGTTRTFDVPHIAAPTEES